MSEGVLFTPRISVHAKGKFAGMRLREIDDKRRLRVTMSISEADLAAHNACSRGESCDVTDIPTGIVVRVTPAACGLDCFCDAEITRVVDNPVAVVQEAEADHLLAQRKAELASR
jgi:hypothetical protein